MLQNEKLVGVLNDLIRINHDRIKGYERAIEELENGHHDLKSDFLEKISQSRLYASRLENYVVSNGHKPAEDTTASGKLFRVWMDFKASITNHDHMAILNSCVFGENAALEEYESALSSEVDFPSDIIQQIVEQRDSIRKSHAALKAMSEKQAQFVD